MSTPSSLDLTGQSSEDEPESRAHVIQQQEQPPQSQKNYEQQQRLGRGSSPSSLQAEHQNNNSSEKNASGRSNVTELSDGSSSRAGGGILTYLPSPIDLWQSRTPTSLLLLPLVFIVFVILQLPLHYNCKTDSAWKSREEAVENISTDLTRVEKELDHVKDDQVEIKGMVTSLRRRLGKLKERRAAREEAFRRMQEEREEEPRKQNQQGIARDGPIATVTMAKALAVATFAGKQNSANDAKKDD